jgi:hypothetical protein
MVKARVGGGFPADITVESPLELTKTGRNYNFALSDEYISELEQVVSGAQASENAAAAAASAAATSEANALTYRNAAQTAQAAAEAVDVALGVIGSTNPSYRFGTNYSSIDSTVLSSWVFDGYSTYPNKLGVNNTKPVGDPPDLGARSNDSGYVAGDADVAAIIAGYDNVNNALAALLASQHSAIYSGATHAAIFGGSFHTIYVGADYASIWGGTQNTVETLCDYGVIVGGERNKLEAGGSFPDEYGHRGVIVGGLINNVSAQWGLALSGQQNTITAKFGSVINGESCTVSGLHGGAAGNSITASGAYSWGFGVTLTVAGARSYAFGEAHNIVSGHDRSSAFGYGCVTPFAGVNMFASRQREDTAGRNCAFDFQCSHETTDTTTTRLSTYGSSSYPTQPESSIVNGFALVTAVSDAGACSTFRIDFTSERVGSGTPTLRANTTTTIYNGLALGTVPTINVVAGGIYRIQVVGLAATNIRWNARVCVEQTVYA